MNPLPLLLLAAGAAVADVSVVQPSNSVPAGGANQPFAEARGEPLSYGAPTSTTFDSTFSSAPTSFSSAPTSFSSAPTTFTSGSSQYRNLLFLRAWMWFCGLFLSRTVKWVNALEKSDFGLLADRSFQPKKSGRNGLRESLAPFFCLRLGLPLHKVRMIN